MKRFLLRPALFTLALTLAACGGDDTVRDRHADPSVSTPTGTAVETAATAPGASALSGTLADGVRTLVIRPVGDEMKFEQTALTVEAGETVRIVFENVATSPAMQHNVVLVTGPDVVNRVGQAAMNASANDYIPEDEAVLAATPLAGPGETVEVTFTAPETPGDYVYICTFPGHYMMMQGTLTVVPASQA